MDPTTFNAKLQELSLLQGGAVGGAGKSSKSSAKPATPAKEQPTGVQSQAFAAVATKPSKPQHKPKGADVTTAATAHEKQRPTREERVAESSTIYNGLVAKLQAKKTSIIAIAAALNDSTGQKLFVMNGSRLLTPLTFRPENEGEGICSRFTFMLNLGSDKRGARVYASTEQIAQWSLLCDTLGKQTSISRLGQLYADTHDSSWLDQRQTMALSGHPPKDKVDGKPKGKKHQAHKAVVFDAFSDPYADGGNGNDGEFA